MKYIIADPDRQNGIELKKILGRCRILDFQGSYITFGTAVKDSLEHPPDMAFIRLGKAEMNAFRLAAAIRERNPLAKVVFISSQKEDAVEAYEYEADGFLLIPFSKKKIGLFLRQNIGEKEMDKFENGKR
jgi:two-component SAPR family response regulator